MYSFLHTDDLDKIGQKNHTRKMKLEQFEHEEKMQLVNVLNQEVQIDGKIQYVNNAIKIYCKSIFDALSGDDSSLIRFYRIEL